MTGWPVACLAPGGTVPSVAVVAGSCVADDRVVALALSRSRAAGVGPFPRFWELFRELSDVAVCGGAGSSGVFVDEGRVAVALVAASVWPNNHMFVSSFASLLSDGVVRRAVAASVHVADVSRWGLSHDEWLAAVVVCADPVNRRVVEVVERVWSRSVVGVRNPFREVVEAASLVGVLGSSGVVLDVVCSMAESWSGSVPELVDVVRCCFGGC